MWWDRSILPGTQFDEVIEAELSAARCVVVVWSEASVASKWVRAEASEGLDRQLLIPVLLEDVRIPLAFRQTQAADLTGWKGEPSHPGFDQVVTAVGMEDRLGHRPSELSGGQQQRVAAARALITKPTIVYADEPSGNLDSKAEAELLDFMRRTVDELAQTIVMVTHDPVAASYSDRIIFLDDGDIVDELMKPTVETILEHMKHLGESA